MSNYTQQYNYTKIDALDRVEAQDFEDLEDEFALIETAINSKVDKLGVAGGLTLYGGTGAGDDLILHSTSHATKGLIQLGANSTYDQVNDRFGIGTLTPDQPLDIDHGSSANGRSMMQSTDVTSSLLHLVKNGDGEAGFGVDSDGNVLIKANTAAKGINIDTAAAANALFIDSAGQVGIGTGSPSAPLDVVTSGNAIARFEKTAGNGVLSVESASGNLITLETGTNDELAFSPNGVEAARFDISGNFGIGTGNPGRNVEVSGSGATAVRIDNTAGKAFDLMVGNIGANAFEIYDVDAAATRAYVASGGGWYVLGGGLLVDNNQSFSSKDVGGTYRPVIKLNAGDDVAIGNSNLDDIAFTVGTLGEAVRIKETSGDLQMSGGGDIRLNNTAAITWLDALSTERDVLKVSGGDDVEIGNSNLDNILFYVGTIGEILRLNTAGNMGFNTSSFGGGSGVVGIANATTVPSSNPTGGGLLYVEGGALKYRGVLGTITTLAAS